MASSKTRGRSGGGRRALLGLLAGTHSRYPDAARDAAYTRSYRTIRLVVGCLGILLPALLILGEAFYLPGPVQVRESLSAYYHTSMQDVFVGVLCVIGVLLATYMSGESRTWDFRVSLLAGIAVLGVVFFPTARTGLPPGSPPCGTLPAPPGCSFVEQALGEQLSWVIHIACAAVFITCLMVMSLLFAASQVLPDDTLAGFERRLRRPAVFWTHLGCALVILAGGLWAVVGTLSGLDIGELTPLYGGEVVCVWAFGISWLLAGVSLTAPARFGRS
jgi:hypothetical protein